MSDPQTRDLRHCLFFDENDKQCRQPATFVCANWDGLQWFACPEHTDRHDWLRMPLDTFLRIAREGVPLHSWWEVGPAARVEARTLLKLNQRPN